VVNVDAPRAAPTTTMGRRAPQPMAFACGTPPLSGRGTRRRRRSTWSPTSGATGLIHHSADFDMLEAVGKELHEGLRRNVIGYHRGARAAPGGGTDFEEFD